ncbi:unnamed protein product, partial [Vicia faba]
VSIDLTRNYRNPQKPVICSFVKDNTNTSDHCVRDSNTQASMSESDVKKERETAHDEDIAATSYVSGQYSIPNCIYVLKVLKEELHWFKKRFSYALELIKDSKNRVIVISLKDCYDDLADWIDYKYQKENPDAF